MRKRYEELTFTDDFLFCKIMQSNPELCRELTELIIGRKIGKIVNLQKQVPIEITADGRGIRFDIYMEDDQNVAYNVEMQAGSLRGLPFRTRYYQGLIDLDQLERGSKFWELKQTYIIFICLDNPYPEVGLHKYSFRSICMEDKQLEMGDGAEKIFLSAKGSSNDVSPELQEFLNFIAGHAPESDLTRRLADLVENSRSHGKWRKEYMTLWEKEYWAREEGREEGRKEGREEGREEERVNTERERVRADRAEKLAREAEAEIERLKKLLKEQ